MQSLILSAFVVVILLINDTGCKHILIKVGPKNFPFNKGEGKIVELNAAAAAHNRNQSVTLKQKSESRNLPLPSGAGREMKYYEEIILSISYETLIIITIAEQIISFSTQKYSLI